MHLSFVSLWLLQLICVLVSAIEPRQVSSHSECRFSPLYSRDQILRNSTDFELDVAYWDGRYHQDGVGFSLSNGLTFGHHLLNKSTGQVYRNQSQTSTPGNEAFHIMLLAQAIAGNDLAARFLYSDNPNGAVQLAGAILTTKLTKYLDFNFTHPGFAGFLPSFRADSRNMRPDNDWHGRVSAVENGKLVWAVYGLCQALRQSNITEFQQLGDSWEDWLDYAKINAKGVFYRGKETGEICKITTLKEGSYPYTSFQKYECEDSCYVNDPFEGELMAWFLHFSGMLNSTQQATLWDTNRAKLQSVNYTGAIDAPPTSYGTRDYSGKPVSGRNIMPITVQRGIFFGSQESIKLLFLPYLDIINIKKVFANAERVRTCNSFLMNSPGMFASTWNITNPSNSQQSPVWINNTGVPSVSFIQQQQLDIITPYSVFPTLLFDSNTGLAWLKNMLDAKRVQSPYGSVASLRRDGTETSTLVDWQTKAPVTLALMGAIVSLVRDAMKAQGIYDEFVNISAQGYDVVFDSELNGGKTFMGEDVHFCMPDSLVPADGIGDFSGCH